MQAAIAKRTVTTSATAGSSRSRRALPRCRRAVRGLTLIELMVVLVVAAILLTVGLPSLVSFIQSNRVATEISSLDSDLQFARSEAIKQGIPVSVCASSDGSSCLGANTWQSGWIVFPDATASGTVAAGVTPLRVRQALSSGDTLVANPAITALTYSRDGFAINLPGATVTLTLHTNPINSAATRCLALTLVGHQTVQSTGTGACS
jgi:type IV fimbrial biogenesis protein FimT